MNIFSLSNWQQVREAQEISANSAGTAAEKYEAQMESIEASINKVQNAWEGFTQRLGSNKALKGFFDVTAGIIKHLDKIIISLTSMLTAMNAYKIGFGSFMNPINKLTNSLNTKHMQFAGSAMQESDKKSIISTGFTKVNANIERLIAVANRIAGIESSGEITTPGFFNLGNRRTQNVANRAKMKELKAQAAFEKQYGLDGPDENFYKSENDRLTNQNRFNRRWGMGLGYATEKDDGSLLYAARSHGQWIDSEGNVISGNKQISALNAQRKAVIKNQIKTGAITGAVAGIQAGMSGTNSYFGGLMGSKDIKINDIQSDTADNIINGVATGAATGLLSAIPGVGPLLGPILGPIIGDGIGGLFKWLRHKDEIDRKQRVEDAKKNLEALNKIESATKGVQSAVYNLSTAMAVVEAKKAVDQLINTILDDSDNRKAIFDKLATLEIKDTNDLERILLGNNDDLKAQILDVINNYMTGEKAEATFASQEQDRSDAQKKFEDAYSKANSTLETAYRINKSKFGDYFDTSATITRSEASYISSLKGATYAEKVENAKAAAKAMREVLASDTSLTSAEKEYLEDEIKKLDSISKEYSDYQATSDKLNRELWNDELASAFSEAGLSMWNTVDIANASLEEVVQTFVDKLELTGQATRDYTGAITDAARSQIETFLRSNERFSALFAGSSKTLNDLIVQQSKQSNLLAQTGAESYEALKDAVDHSTDEMYSYAKKVKGLSQEMANNSKEVGDAVAYLRKIVYGADNSELNAYAKALHMTTEEVLAFQKQLGSVTLSDILKTPAELRDSMGDLINVFGALSSSAQLSGEMLEKVNGQYFTLYNQYDESGNIISTSAENLLQNLRQRLFGSANDTSTQAFLYQNATFEQFRTSSDFYKGFQKEIERQIKSGLLSESAFDYQKIKDAQTLNDVIDYVGNNNNLSNVLATYLDGLNMQNMYFKELQDKLIEWQKHENQVTMDNLKGQIDALEEINNERQREIDLIKAKEALENAKNEKKRVYRAGVGWTYEADSQSISEAEKKLEDLETEKEKQGLQYQVDLLQQQNDILDHIAENEQLEALKNIFDEYQSYMKNELGERVTSGMNSILEFIGTDRTMTWSEYIRLMGKEKKEEENASKEGFKSSLENMKTTADKMTKLTTDANSQYTSSNIHKKEYIAQQQAQNAAYNDYLTYRKKLIDQGYSEDELSSMEEEILGKDIGNINNLTNISNAKLGSYNDEYTYITGHWNDNGDEVKDQGINYELRPSGTYTSDEISKLRKQYKEHPEKMKVRIVSGGSASNDPIFTGDIDTLPNGTVLYMGSDDKDNNKDWDKRYMRKNGQSFEKLTPVKLMHGTADLPKDIMALINEIGTEGIVTPQGTLTALPSKSGVVPADLTRNLYDLGEVAPTLIKRLKEDNVLNNDFNGVNQDDHSMHIASFNATFNTIDNYDFEQLLVKVRQYIATTKHNRGQ